MKFHYEPGMQIHLGVGWEPQKPFSNKLIGGYLLTADQSDETPNGTDFTEQKFIENFNQYEETTRLSLSASGKTSLGLYKVSGSASHSQERAIFRNSRNIVWAISAKRTYDPISAIGVKLSEPGEKLFEEIADSGDIGKLKKRVGSHIVTSISRQAQITLLYIFTASNSSALSKIKSAISAHVSGTTDVSAETSFERAVRNVDSSVQLSVQILHTGIDDDSASLSDIISVAPGDLSTVREKIGEALNAIQWERAPIVEFSAEPLSDVFDVPNPDYSADVLEMRKNRLQDIQHRVVQRILELDDLLEMNRTSEIELQEGAEVEIKAEIKKLDQHFVDLGSLLNVASVNPDDFSSIPEVEIPYGKLHWVKFDFGMFTKWGASVSGNHYDNHSERIKATATYWPEFVIKSSSFIGRLELVRNGVILFSISQQELRDKLNQGRFDARGYYSSTHSMSEYCWRGHWGETCNPWAADVRGHMNRLKSRERKFSYLWRVMDIENNVHERSIPNPAEQDY